MKNIVILIALLFSFSAVTAQKTIDARDIMRDVKNGKNIEYSNATIEGILDFTYMNEKLPKLPTRKRWWNNGGSNEVTKQITSKVSFVNCTFKDDVLAYIPHEDSGYTFVGNFENDVIFRGCTFDQKAMFKYSDFERKADFSSAKFNDDTTFKYAKFENHANFKNTYFDEPATFKYADFKEHVSFENSVFDETATFKYAEFNNGVSFNNVQFKEDLNIKYTKVKGDFDIENMEVAFDIDSKYTKINGSSFNKYLLKRK